MCLEDVQRALYRAYKKELEVNGTIDGKSSEGQIELIYPTYWKVSSEEEFLKPIGLSIFSYALSDSRKNYIWLREEETQYNHCTWYSNDIFKKAVEVIEEWTKDITNESDNKR